MRFLLLLSLSLRLAAVAACSSSSSGGGGGACQAYTPPAGFDPTTPTTSFANDVMPVFQASCGRFTECHGASGSNNQAGLYLGPDAARVYQGLVGVAAHNYPSMPRVTANDPKNSYLIHKIDGDACALPNCTGQCENTMPNDTAPGQADLLPVDQRDKIRRWIAQGAPNN